MTTSYYVVGIQSNNSTEGCDTTKFPQLITNTFPNPLPTTPSTVAPITPGILPTTNMIANAAIYGLHPAASLIPSLYMQNLIIQYQKLMSEYATTANLETTRQEPQNNLNQISPLLLSSIMSSMADKRTCLSVPKRPTDETPLDLCTKRTPSPLNLNFTDGCSRRSPPSSPSYEMSPSTPTSLITSVPSKTNMIWSPASSCEEEENAKKFFNIKNNNMSIPNDTSSAFINGHEIHPKSPNSIAPNISLLNTSSIERKLLSSISSPSLNHLGQIGEFSFKSSPQPTTTSSSTSLTSQMAISHNSGDEHGSKKPRIFKVNVIEIQTMIHAQPHFVAIPYISCKQRKRFNVTFYDPYFLNIYNTPETNNYITFITIA